MELPPQYRHEEYDQYDQDTLLDWRDDMLDEIVEIRAQLEVTTNELGPDALLRKTVDDPVTRQEEIKRRTRARDKIRHLRRNIREINRITEFDADDADIGQAFIEAAADHLSQEDYDALMDAAYEAVLLRTIIRN